jgi:integrase
MRVGELAQLEWRDVDVAECRFRIRHGKTARRGAGSACRLGSWSRFRRPAHLTTRAQERQVFQGFSSDVAKNVMARACKAAGIPHFHPHDLRHRYASVKLREGVPVTDLAAQLGHLKKSMTLDT